MAWELEASDEFRDRYRSLELDLRHSIAAGVDRLQQHGPELGRPFADTLKGSRFPNMKELRVQHRGKPCRNLFISSIRKETHI
jgi:hypothetical protein